MFAVAWVVAVATIAAFYKLDPKTFGQRALYFIGFTAVILLGMFTGYRMAEEGVPAEVREWIFPIFFALVIYASIICKDD